MTSRKRKAENKFTRYMQKKLIALFLFFTIFLIVIIIRIIVIQQDNGSNYEKIVLNQQGYHNVTIPYQRGEILDSKGTILATSLDVYNVILDCKMINQKKAYLEATIPALIKSFDNVSEDELLDILSKHKDQQYYVLKKKLTYEQIQDFVALKDDKKNNPDIKGVWFEKEYIRKYPFDSLACKVLGFTASGGIGIGGLEDYYNNSLNGINGRSFGHLNSDGNLKKENKNAINGNSLVTTLDATVQRITEKKIAEFNESHRDAYSPGPGSQNTGVIIMNVKNGEIIAMADNTSYNLNDPRDLSMHYTKEEISSMGKEKTLDELNRIWQNFCITSTYEPGSTIKPLTVATGLDAGNLKGDESYNCTGSRIVAKRATPISCANHVAHGVVSIEQAIVKSCNCALMDMASTIGVDTFTSYQNIFSIGMKTNIDLSGEARTDTLIHSAANMKRIGATLQTNAFGQNFDVTMIQVASAFSSIINGGYYYQPHFVKKIVTDTGHIKQMVKPILLKQTISNKTSAQLREYLYKTVAEGTGMSAKVPGHSMGGKTGTAETLPRGNGKYVVSFIGYTPADDPEILIYVVIKEPNAENQATSIYASELAKNILTDILPYLNIFPDE